MGVPDTAIDDVRSIIDTVSAAMELPTSCTSSITTRW